jgi:hypothetical protein
LGIFPHNYGIDRNIDFFAAIRSIISPILFNCSSSSAAYIVGGIRCSSSIFLTRLGETPANPINRSRAIGGHVAILSIGSTEGLACNVSGRIFVKFSVSNSARSTRLVVSSRVSLNACGAKFLVVSLRRPMIEAADRTIGVTQARGAYTQVLGINLKTSA